MRAAGCQDPRASVLTPAQAGAAGAVGVPHTDSGGQRLCGPARTPHAFPQQQPGPDCCAQEPARQPLQALPAGMFTGWMGCLRVGTGA